MKHWVFDLDGTLINSSGQYEKFVTSILKDEGIDVTRPHLDLAYKYFNPDEYFAQFLKEPQQIQEAVRKLMAFNLQFAHESPAFDGIEELLVFLKSKNVRLSVWTGRELHSAVKILEATRLLRYFDQCVGRTCVAQNKPHADGLLKILKDSNHQHNEVVMVGDHEYDMKGARAAKVQAVSVNWDGQSQGAHLHSDFHFEKVGDLIHWAQEIYA